MCTRPDAKELLFYAYLADKTLFSALPSLFKRHNFLVLSYDLDKMKIAGDIKNLDFFLLNKVKDPDFNPCLSVFICG
jgi:hypothetical protein